MDSREDEDPGESGSLNRLMRRELSVCAKRNKLNVCEWGQTGGPRQGSIATGKQPATSVFTMKQTRISARSSLLLRCHVQPQPQTKVARAYRIEGAIVLYRSAARSLFKAERSLPRAEPWWSIVLGAPLFLRTLFRLVFFCPHRHKGPPITLRESIPSNLPRCRSGHGGGTYITCMDCGHKFAYNHKTRRLVDFWGVHDAEALAGVRRRVDRFFSPLRGLAARIGRVNMRIPMSQLVKSLHRLGISTKPQWIKSRRLIASKWVPQSDLNQAQTRSETTRLR